MTTETRGAYGMRLPDLPGQQWLTPVPATWPEWRLDRVDEATLVGAMAGVARPDDGWGEDHWRDDVAVVADPTGRQSVVIRDQGRTLLPSDYVPAEPEWVHPVLFPTALVVNDWHRRIGFHAAAFLDAHGRAWAVAGDREAGKSTTVAWLAAHGVPVLTDDLTITDGVTAFAGPRCVDLREPTARRFGMGRDLGLNGARDRFRVDLPPVTAAAPYAGMIRLEFGPATSLLPATGAGRMAVLAGARALLVRQQHARSWLDVVARPCMVFSRPRDWGSLDDAMTMLLDGVADIPA